jgi:hypothetical protein
MWIRLDVVGLPGFGVGVEYEVNSILLLSEISISTVTG